LTSELIITYAIFVLSITFPSNRSHLDMVQLCLNEKIPGKLNIIIDFHCAPLTTG